MADDSEGQKRSTPNTADGAEKTMSDTADLDRDALVVDDEVVAADAEVIPESAADADVVVATEQVTTEQTTLEEPAALATLAASPMPVAPSAPATSAYCVRRRTPPTETRPSSASSPPPA